MARPRPAAEAWFCAPCHRVDCAGAHIWGCLNPPACSACGQPATFLCTVDPEAHGVRLIVSFDDCFDDWNDPR